jgi:hypothetical protein
VAVVSDADDEADVEAATSDDDADAAPSATSDGSDARRHAARAASTASVGSTAAQHAPPHSHSACSPDRSHRSRHESSQYTAARQPRHGTGAGDSGRKQKWHRVFLCGF